jgi:hypothetical protein
MALKTRLLKIECFDCGAVGYMTRVHLARIGPLACPCNGQPMASPAWDDYQRDEAAADAAAQPTQHSTRPIRSQWVEHCRRPHECSRCRGEIPADESAMLEVYTVAGEFLSEYTCPACHPSTSAQYATGANQALGGC